jgi:hypothetical protein
MILRSIVLLALAIGTVLWCVCSPAPKGGQEAGVVMTLPTRVAGFVGIPGEPSKVEKAILPTDTEFAKMTYATATNDPAERDLAYVSVVLAGAESRSIHRPEVCLTGQGWTIAGSTIVPVEIVPGRTLLVKDLSLEGSFADKQGKTSLVKAHYVYWFVGRDFNTPSHFERLWHSTWDAVLHNINHRWAYVAVMAHVTDGMAPATTGERGRTDEQTRHLISFLIERLVPHFQQDFLTSTPRKP